MPVGRQAQAPGRVDVALVVDYDVCLPGAADVLDPVCCGGLVAVRDGYAVDLGVVLYGEGGEVAEGLLGDCFRRGGPKLLADINGEIDGWVGI